MSDALAITVTFAGGIAVALLLVLVIDMLWRQ